MEWVERWWVLLLVLVSWGEVCRTAVRVRAHWGLGGWVRHWVLSVAVGLSGSLLKALGEVSKVVS